MEVLEGGGGGEDDVFEEEFEGLRERLEVDGGGGGCEAFRIFTGPWVTMLCFINFIMSRPVEKVVVDLVVELVLKLEVIVEGRKVESLGFMEGEALVEDLVVVFIVVFVEVLTLEVLLLTLNLKSSHSLKDFKKSSLVFSSMNVITAKF